MRDNDYVSTVVAEEAAAIGDWFAAFNDNDIDALVALADPDIAIMPDGGARSVPTRSWYHGYEGIRAMLQAFDRFPKLHITHETPQPVSGGWLVKLHLDLGDGEESRESVCVIRFAEGRLRRIQAFDAGTELSPHDWEGDWSRAAELSPREREVLLLLGRGYTIDEIAEDLVLSPLTIRTHVRNGKEKLDARTTAHAVAIVVRANALES